MPAHRLAAVLLLATVAHGIPCGPSAVRNDTGLPTVPGVTCGLLPSRGGLPDQCCCTVAGGATRCLPHVILAGAQKSGSTVLFGYLTLHPQFAPPRDKELHAFDEPAGWTDPAVGVRSYLDKFPVYDPYKVGARAPPTLAAARLHVVQFVGFGRCSLVLPLPAPCRRVRIVRMCTPLVAVLHGTRTAGVVWIFDRRANSTMTF